MTPLNRRDFLARTTVATTALAAVLMAWPRWRWLARWPALLLTLGATAACYVATVSGADPTSGVPLACAIGGLLPPVDPV